MAQPLISIAMQTYNQQEYVAAAIESFLCQTFQDFELVVIDDASTDNTAHVIQKLAAQHPNKIRFIQNENNLGIPATFHKVMAACKATDFICWVGGDDIYLPHFLEDHVNTHRQNPSVPITVANGIWFDSATGEDIRHNYPLDAPPEFTYNAIMHSQCVFAPATMIKVNALTCVKNIEPTKTNEWPIFAELLHQGDGAYTNTVSMRYRRHTGNLSNDYDLMWSAIFEALYHMRDNISSEAAIYKSLARYHRLYAKHLKRNKKQLLRSFWHKGASLFYKKYAAIRQFFEA